MPALALLVLALLGLAAELAPSDLTGRFGAVVRIPARMELSWLGELDVTYQSVLLIDARELDGKLLQRHVACDITLLDETPVADLEVEWERAEAVAERTYPVELEGERYRADLGIRWIGVERGVRGELPKEPDAPGVIDAERDGDPGATIDVKTPVGGLRIFVVQRDHPVLEGTVESPDYITGTTHLLELEQEVLGSAPPLPRPEVRTVPYEGRATFEAFRVPEGITCAELERQWPRYLERARGSAR